MRQPGAEGGDHRGLIAGILLAAGRSIRFGRQKLLQPWNGEPMVRRAARVFLEAGLTPVVVVVSRASGAADVLRGLPLLLVENPHPEAGISSSIVHGARALPPQCAAALIGVADQPHLSADAIGELCRAFQPGKIVVPRYGDQRGNPAIFDRNFFAELLGLEGDRGGQQVVARHPDALIDVDLPSTMGEDIDMPEQWSG